MTHAGGSAEPRRRFELGHASNSRAQIEEAYTFLGMLLAENRGDYVGARDAFRNAIKYEFTPSAHSHYNLGRLMWKADKNDAEYDYGAHLATAEYHLRKTLDMQPEHSEARSYLETLKAQKQARSRGEL